MKYLKKEDYGRVPSYLLERKIELAAQQEAQERMKEAALIPPGKQLKDRLLHLEFDEWTMEDLKTTKFLFACLPFVSCDLWHVPLCPPLRRGSTAPRRLNILSVWTL